MASALFLQVSVITEMFLDLSLPVSDEVKPHLAFYLKGHILYSLVRAVSMSHCNYIS